VLQFDMWKAEGREVKFSDRHDWNGLKALIRHYGVRNATVAAQMPTATSAHILGNTEGVAPRTSNLYVRRVLDGEYIQVNPHLRRDLEAHGLCTEATMRRIQAAEGSVAALEELPAEVRALHPTVWETSQRRLLHFSAASAPFIDQGESHKAWLDVTPAEIAEANRRVDAENRVVAASGGADTPRKPAEDYGSIMGRKLASYHMTAWRLGLKTGLYYLHTKAATEAVKMTLTGTEAGAAARTKRQREESGVDAGANGAGGGPQQNGAKWPRIEVADGPVCRRNDPDCEACQA
jgi:ribonucleotide reductase alpha subunit